MPRTSPVQDKIRIADGISYGIISSDDQVGVTFIPDMGSDITIAFTNPQVAQAFAQALIDIAENMMFRVSRTLDAPDRIKCPDCGSKSFYGMVDAGHGNKVQCPRCNILEIEWKRRNTVVYPIYPIEP